LTTYAAGSIDLFIILLYYQKMKNPKVSIIIPSYNYEILIKDAIDSVLAQSFKDFELIIVDDGSSDNSVSVIENYVQQYDNIFLYTHENNANQGLSKSVQLGLKHAKGEFVAFLECDDFWVKTYLERKVEIFETNQQVGIVFNDVEVLGEEHRINSLKSYFDDCRKRCAAKKYPASLAYETLLLEIISNFSSTMMKKSVFAGLDFDTPIAPYLDWWLFSQITYLHDSYFVNEKLTHLRLHTKSYISNTQSKITIKDKKDMFNKLLKLLENSSDGVRYKNLIAKIFEEKSTKTTRDKDYKSDFVKKFANKKVFLYDAGAFLAETLKDYDFSKINIEGVIDADKTKSGKAILGYKIYHPDEIVSIKPDVILISMQEPESVYADLQEFVAARGLNIPVITDFFSDARYKALNNRDLSLEEVLTELF
jgi:glycosyltransferase involved in cell wall biosynthesis